MKNRILNTVLLSACSSFIILHGSFAQTNSNNKFYTDIKHLQTIIYSANLTTIGYKNEASLSEISTKAMRDFRKTFKTTKGEKWYKFKDGFLAKFTEEITESNVLYDRKGNWECTILHYPEAKLSEEIRKSVKSEFYDYSITLVDEIQIDDKVIYIVHMQNQTTWKNVCVRDGEIEVIEDFDKK
jgi:hypothetical protein